MVGGGGDRDSLKEGCPDARVEGIGAPKLLTCWHSADLPLVGLLPMTGFIWSLFCCKNNFVLCTKPLTIVTDLSAIMTYHSTETLNQWAGWYVV